MSARLIPVNAGMPIRLDFDQVFDHLVGSSHLGDEQRSTLSVTVTTRQCQTTTPACPLLGSQRSVPARSQLQTNSVNESWVVHIKRPETRFPFSRYAPLNPN